MFYPACGCVNWNGYTVIAFQTVVLVGWTVVLDVFKKISNPKEMVVIPVCGRFLCLCDPGLVKNVERV